MDAKRRLRDLGNLLKTVEYFLSPRFCRCLIGKPKNLARCEAKRIVTSATMDNAIEAIANQLQRGGRRRPAAG